MKQKSVPGILCLSLGILLLLACLPGALLSGVENAHAPMFLHSLEEESGIFALLLSHGAETAGIGVVLLLIGLLCLTELPGEAVTEDSTDATTQPKGSSILLQEEAFTPKPLSEYRVVFPEDAPMQGKGYIISEEARNRTSKNGT